MVKGIVYVCPECKSGMILCKNILSPNAEFYCIERRCKAVFSKYLVAKFTHGGKVEYE